jgi:pimeloyl-ACP methyl ester carboxylesterase
LASAARPGRHAWTGAALGALVLALVFAIPATWAREPGPRPRTTAQLVDELCELLDQAGTSGPYLPVGHSMGGIMVRALARRCPDAVAGMVLSVHAVQLEQPEVVVNAIRDVLAAISPTPAGRRGSARPVDLRTDMPRGHNHRRAQGPTRSTYA